MGNVSINASLQGSGFQSAASIIASLIFSAEDTTVIIEEPEVFLHKDSQEVLADLFNHVVSTSKKQVIFSTHSWDMLLPFASDIAQDMARRGSPHIRADPQKFKMFLYQKISGVATASEYPLATKTWLQFKTDMKRTIG
jgi:ABC-type cobalamin/Fe3+-siderophores transport system ATPase subunit